MQDLYPYIFKRKSFHRFEPFEPLSQQEKESLVGLFASVAPLDASIETKFLLVPIEETTCKRGEYCILIYSEQRGTYLENAGYMGAQLDLLLAKQNIGCCWYGVGKPMQDVCDGLRFVIMLAIAKQEPSSFRKDYTKSKRKLVGEIWKGEAMPSVAEVVRYTPSACNTQPWLVRKEGQHLLVFRVSGKRGIMSKALVGYYNRIDVGIFLCFLELCLDHERVSYTRSLVYHDPTGTGPFVCAEYTIG
ncbi:hypothetical protein SDC9_72149 [bioreactor metagenome]|jgi:hypothetical protein|uniref:Putative nitroreductase TM1586 domain-containing protein n=1 Tax=bioreactor metagenome TaxID=1076179 RepID=A0A644YCN4_9ZZZZ|nr:nitroreductase family protein [Sphaerochaeta sp.]